MIWPFKRKPQPRLTDAEKAASAASYLSRYAAAKRRDAKREAVRAKARSIREQLGLPALEVLG